ncbi:unnamed protein product [Prorocentrum cordatum]|uniref:Decapping nuclease n=1 Tax=Prorocentrum cordatum TaxID=2364126 RepID=A0ABN9X141_9DINO|nr:unnamed protein product [Polarella glacialis]
MSLRRHIVVGCRHAPCFNIRSLVLPASRFDGIVNGSAGRADVYEGAPFANMNAKLRGDLFAGIVRTSELIGEKDAHVTDAEPGMRCDGRRRAASTAEYDWLCNGRRVECKSAMLTWSGGARRWSFRFQSVKFRSFDILLLVLYTPLELIVYQHDLSLGISSSGARTETEGCQICFYGPGGVGDWRVALKSVLGRLDAPSNQCRQVARFSLQHASVVRALSNFRQTPYAVRMDEAYHDVPLASLAGAVRGERIQAIARLVDTILNMGSFVMDPVVGARSNGARRSLRQAEYDWSRDGRRIECKSSQLVWDPRKRVWSVTFRNIKPASFDDLVLCIYTPHGIFLYRHSGNFVLSSIGVRSERWARGYSVSVSGGRHKQDWSIALDSVLKKVEQLSCEYVAFVEW